MKTFVSAAILSVGFAFVVSSAATAQSRCNDRAGMLEYLATDFGEVPIAVGIETQGVTLEVLASPNGETWTIIVTDPMGVVCAVATGTDWESVKPIETGPAA